MSFQRPFLISLRRSYSVQPWGFTLAGGKNGPLTVSGVTPDGLAERKGVKPGDHVIQVGPVNVEDLTPNEVYDVISRCGNPLEMFVVREPYHGGRAKAEAGITTTDFYAPHETRFDHHSPQYTAGRQSSQASSPGVYGASEAPVLKRSAVYQVLKEEEARGYRNAPTHDRFRPQTQRNQPPSPESPVRAQTVQPQFTRVSSPTVHYPKVSTVFPAAPPVSQPLRFPASSSPAVRQAPPTGGSTPPPSRSHTTQHGPVTATTKRPQQQQAFPPQYSKPETYVATVQMAPSPTGSPSTVRKSRQEVWPPKTSSVRMLPKTGFSPTVMREHGYKGKRFVWPPPKEGEMIDRDLPGDVPHAGHVNWNPSSPAPTIRPPAFAPRTSPTRRTTDNIWPPPESMTRENAVKPMPRPVRRMGKFEDFVKHRASTGVPVTYRPPPRTQHSQVNGVTEEVVVVEEEEVEEVEEEEEEVEEEEEEEVSE